MKINYKSIGGLLLAMIITSTGTLYLESTGDYDNCRAQWILNPDGTFTCPKDNSTHYCYDIEDRGSGWYRCWIGNVVQPTIIATEKDLGKGRWVCNPNECEKMR